VCAGGPLAHLRQHRVGCQSRAELAQTPTARTAYQLQQSTSCHRACQQYIACQLSHSSLMMYRSPAATAYQLPQSLPAAAELASRHRACQPSQSLPAATELASCHRACQLPQGLLTVRSLPTVIQLAFFPPFPQFLPSLCRSYQSHDNPSR
jgi:hypothetical protein